ncbi:Wzz/FepE/Etk N-terminal domain-containing protein [Niallia oryzisoli]|uniref:Wzz/FepE/Etk N-terminal domain-containing protein n=1 Tax=Niallia oryzisoli TaxID=1737571 RepID=A0ABZ2CEX2_9BACI
MEETIHLKEVLLKLKKRLGLIVIFTTLAVIATGVMSYFVLPPIYQASTQLLVNKTQSEQPLYNPGEVQTNLQLINSYNVIIKSPAILDQVVEELGMNLTVAELNEKITVSSEEDSQVLNLTVQDSDPQMAANIANETAEVFQEKIVTLMNIDNVNILSKAKVEENPSPIKPKPLLNMALALVIGFMLGVGTALFLELLDNTIKSEQDIERLLQVPVLGAVAAFDSKSKSRKKNKKKEAVRGGSYGS